MVAEPCLLRWEKPASGWIKCNDDAAFVIGFETISLGLCFRHSNSQFVVDMTQWQEFGISTLEGETWTLLITIKQTRYRGLNRVQFEIDLKLLVDVIHMSEAVSQFIVPFYCS
jgi:hypothetical protein